MSTEEIILKLTKQLLPTGRAFKAPKNSLPYKLLKALSKSEARAYDFAISTLDRVLPDNNNFSANDATLWEKRLNLPVAPSGLNLTERKLKIDRKYAFPGTAIYRQNYRYIQDQLQKAGFNVWVHENRFPDGMGGYEPVDVTDNAALQHGFDVEHGYGTQMGEVFLDLLANSADPNESYSLGEDPENLKGTFFIGGETYPNRAIIDVDEIRNFRKLVLQLKPAATVAVLLLDYVQGGNFVSVGGNNLNTVGGDNLTSVQLIP